MLTPEEIKVARKRLDETQSEFAARFGVHTLTVARWEQGKPPTRGAALKMLEAIIQEAAE